MTLNEVWTELEADMEWRQSELRLLANNLGNLKRASERDQFRRTILVMLYAHIEGYCKVALLTYVRALNQSGLCCNDVSASIAAASFDDVFHALSFGDKKGRVFKGSSPDDAKLEIFARRCDFMDQLSHLVARSLSIPDDIVNTESNLGAVVLRRNLFRLGFPVDLFVHHESALDELKNRRNNIAHGVDSSIVRDADYERLRRTVLHVMNEITLLVIEALEHKRYKRTVLHATIVPPTASPPP